MMKTTTQTQCIRTKKKSQAETRGDKKLKDFTFIYRSAEQYDKHAGSLSLKACAENIVNIKNQNRSKLNRKEIKSKSKSNLKLPEHQDECIAG